MKCEDRCKFCIHIFKVKEIGPRNDSIVVTFYYHLCLYHMLSYHMDILFLFRYRLCLGEYRKACFCSHLVYHSYFFKHFCYLSFCLSTCSQCVLGLSLTSGGYRSFLFLFNYFFSLVFCLERRQINLQKVEYIVFFTYNDGKSQQLLFGILYRQT